MTKCAFVTVHSIVDENIPRSLAAQIKAMGHSVQDVRDIGPRGRPDSGVFEAAMAADAIIITCNKAFAVDQGWPTGFTAGVIVVNLPDDTPANVINAKPTNLLPQRLPVSLPGAAITVELRPALSWSCVSCTHGHGIPEVAPPTIAPLDLYSCVSPPKSARSGVQLHVEVQDMSATHVLSGTLNADN